MAKKTITRFELDRCMTEHGIRPEPYYFDGVYLALTKNDLAQLNRNYKQDMEARGKRYGANFTSWQERQLDCDKFAEFYRCTALEMSAVTGANAAAPAGVFVYKQDAGGWHAINLVFIIKRGVLRPVFIEPQAAVVFGKNTKPLVLSATEKDTNAGNFYV